MLVDYRHSGFGSIGGVLVLVALGSSGVRLVIFCCWKYCWYSVVGIVVLVVLMVYWCWYYRWYSGVGRLLVEWFW